MVGTTALEAVVTTATGVALGLTVVTGAVVGIALAARRSVGTSVIEIPWTILLCTTLGSPVLATLASALVAARTTRVSPVRLAAARD